MASSRNTPTARAKELLYIILEKDKDRLDRIDRYRRGDHDSPYMPDNATAEYELLAERCVSNWMPLLINTPTQACYVDNFRPGRMGALDDAKLSPEWKHWQRSKQDSRQSAIYADAFTFGHSFALTEKTSRGVETKGLPTRRTAALYRDPANDDTPVWALTIIRHVREGVPGEARMWDKTYEYSLTFKSEQEVVVRRLFPHGATTCPVTRFAASVDLEGRTVGVVEPLIELQNRINQTIFDLLVAQTYSSFKVRTVSGMAPPMKMKAVETEDGITLVPELDEKGRPIPEPIKLNAARFMYAKDSDVKFGTLDETPLDGFISSVDMSIRHLSAVSQTPPTYLLGQIANLSADALKAAERAQFRKVEAYRTSFGESWERVFRLAAELEGISEAANDFDGKVIWRDVELSSLAQAADGLGKLADQLEIPKRGLWQRVPNVSATELREWAELRETDDYERQIAESLDRATRGIGGQSSSGAAGNQPRAA